MIYYKAICRLHGWESPGLYIKRTSAVKSAAAHRANTQGSHDIVILEIFIPDGGLEIRSEESF
ncbi:hypothetical protein FLAT13_03114 [Flavobacterium salmonis]|uniref:Uncharacterized protein n=1 Tax=Flavobacterium salmonis TaxID=2654844 RepID=A0A6V6Z325_9FLAO|nr:hypothetical protein FLAT13_03114 [Flavobacterium salmonis]